jgi:hypothetical protein
MDPYFDDVRVDTPEILTMPCGRLLHKTMRLHQTDNFIRLHPIDFRKTVYDWMHDMIRRYNASMYTLLKAYEIMDLVMDDTTLPIKLEDDVKGCAACCLMICSQVYEVYPISVDDMSRSTTLSPEKLNEIKAHILKKFEFQIAISGCGDFIEHYVSKDTANTTRLHNAYIYAVKIMSNLMYYTTANIQSNVVAEMAVTMAKCKLVDDSCFVAPDKDVIKSFMYGHPNFLPAPPTTNENRGHFTTIDLTDSSNTAQSVSGGGSSGSSGSSGSNIPKDYNDFISLGSGSTTSSPEDPNPPWWVRLVKNFY